ncbi:MAG: ATP-binding protein [Pseudomonadota bacterium]
MNPPSNTSRSFYGAPALGLIGAVVVLMGILVFVTVTDIYRQKAGTTRLLMEKGAALIRSIEAGSRTGMAFSPWREMHLQRLLAETAAQGDIAYIAVVNTAGRVLASSGGKDAVPVHLETLDLITVAESTSPLFRRVVSADGRPVFEVYRRFIPMGRPGGMTGMGRGRGMMHHMFEDDRNAPAGAPPQEPIIFVGLDMTAIENAQAADVRHSLLMAAVLLLVGVAGFYLVHVLQNYRAARSTMARLESFSANLADSLPMGLITTDSAHQVVSLNPAAESILGVPTVDIVGRPATDALPPELYHALEQVGTAGSIERELESCRCTGGTRPLSVSASSWHDDDGRFLGHILLVKDLTEVYALRKEIAKSQRLASLGSLAAGVAHEIRNPLSSIKGFATYFKERYRDVDADRETADIMIGEVDRMNRVVGQLLELSHPVKISPAPAEVRELLERSVSAVRPQLSEKRITVTIDAGNDLPPIPVDADRIQQVFINLYLNAVAAMPEKNGRLSIGAAPHPQGVLITVADNGTGIPENQVAHVFDPYFTTKSTGTGLGLAIVHNIVEAHGGSISAHSAQGQTTFSLLLPLEKGKKA